MKRFLLCLYLSTISLVALAQNKVDLTIKYNIGLARYEVYAIPNFTAPNSSTATVFRLGASQITVVLPQAASNSPLSISSVGGGTWADNTQSYAPGNGTTSDFHAIASPGSGSSLFLLNLAAGVESLLFTFTTPDGCLPGVRLFNNGVDPSSTLAMGGGDYNNNFFGTVQSVGAEVYRVNTNNNGTVCTVCNLVAPTLSK